MHVMTKSEAERHNLYTIDPVTGQKIPFSTIRFELTEKEKAEQEKEVASGLIPF